ncbi:MAG TPA: MarR family transcriptional regulator [Gemmatimonadaceae bacterium]|nr:MarR family transcriptional regulator [Gemmatimonadaceae bacterium]
MARRPENPQQFVEQFGLLLEADGVPRVAAHLLGVLLISAEARSLEDLAAQLGVSKASVSVNARLLEEKGVIEREGRQADRRDYYRVADDMLERTLEQRINRWRRFQETFAGACVACGNRDDVVRQRLDGMAHVYGHMLDATVRVLSDWRTKGAKRAIPSPVRSR